MWKVALLVLIGISTLYSTVAEKVIICGVCKNIERAVPNIIASAERLGNEFLDYRVVIYENNSADSTKMLLHNWAATNPKVLVYSENLSNKKLAKACQMGVLNRTELIARARNKVLDSIMQESYNDYKYVVWADLDFLEPWDVEHIIETILHPEEEWDAVFANGSYDQFAYRDAQFPIGFELIGEHYWWHIEEMRATFIIAEEEPWRPVYSAFGGLGIYKRDSLKGSRYSGVVTKDLETLMEKWLVDAYKKEKVPLLKYYDLLLKEAPIFNLMHDRLQDRNRYPTCMGIRQYNAYGEGKIAWFSCTEKMTLPWTCEHITLHASMIQKGHGKLFLNPRIISNHPPS